ncbi:UmuC domain-containing protein, partial [Haematococcus lacustris]
MSKGCIKGGVAPGQVAKLESGRDLSRTWLVVDMDAFFAAVEERDNPGL